MIFSRTGKSRKIINGFDWRSSCTMGMKSEKEVSAHFWSSKLHEGKTLGSSTHFARSESFASARITSYKIVVYHERSERSERSRMVPSERIELS